MDMATFRRPCCWRCMRHRFAFCVHLLAPSIGLLEDACCQLRNPAEEFVAERLLLPIKKVAYLDLDALNPDDEIVQ